MLFLFLSQSNCCLPLQILHSDPLLSGSRLRLPTPVAFSVGRIGLGHHPDPGEWHLKKNKIDPASGLKVYGVCLRQAKNRVPSAQVLHETPRLISRGCVRQDTSHRTKKVL